MKRALQFFAAFCALAGVVVWTIFTSDIWQLGNSFKGMGDGAGTVRSADGSQFLSFALIAVIWLLPVSPYLCIMATSINLIVGKQARIAFVYSLVGLTISTLACFLTTLPRFAMMAGGNIFLGVLWAFSYGKK